MRSRIRTVLIVAITLALLAFFFRDVNFPEVWAETRRANPWLLLAAVVVTGVTYALRAWRWQSLLAPIGPTRFGTAFRATVIGFAMSFLLPARAGELIRPYLLAKKEGLRPAAAFATIILERLLDLATVLLLFGFFVFTVPAGVLTGDASQLTHVKFWGGVAAAAAVGSLGVLFALAGHPERLGQAAGRVERVLPARAARIVAHLVETFAQGLVVMRRPAQLGVALLQSFPLWLSLAAGIWLTSQAFSITFPYSGSFLVMALLVVGVAVPTPGQVGGFHVAYQVAVQTFFGAPDDRAIGAAIVLHALSFLPVTLVGAVFMAREGLTFQSAQKLASSEAS
jgi:hypothetical protein